MENISDGPATVWRSWNYEDRLPGSVFVDAATGRGVTGRREAFSCATPGPLRAASLLAALPGETRQVWICGGRPGGSADGARAWGLAAALPPGWRRSKTGHYLDDPELPVYRWRRPDGKEVAVRRFAAWADGDPGPADALDAMDAFDRHLRAAVNVRGRDRHVIEDGRAATWGTPGGLGVRLWRTMIGVGQSWPLLSKTHQKLVRATAAQGRVEPADGPRLAGRRVDGVVVLDRRLAYAAHCKEVAHGPASLERADDWPLDDLGHRRARYRIVCTVPDGWAHVGLVPERAEDGETWTYPNEPGRVVGADPARPVWVDGCELLMLRRWGWPFAVAERLAFAERRRDPLGPWSEALLRGRTAALGDGDLPPATRALAAGMFRNVLLHAVGLFFAGRRRVTRYAPVGTPVPGRLLPRRLALPGGDVLLWTEWKEPKEADLCHPEFAACVWRRANVALLDGPGAAGALHVAYDDAQAEATGLPLLLGLRTDSVWLDGPPPRPWPDDGKAGQYRPKAAIAGPVRLPARWEDAIALLEAA